MQCHVYRTLSTTGHIFYVLVREDDRFLTIYKDIIINVDPSKPLRFVDYSDDEELFYESDVSIELLDTMDTKEILAYLKLYLTMTGG